MTSTARRKCGIGLTSFRRTCPRAGQYPYPRRRATPFPCLAGAALDERLNNAHKGREESTRIPSSPWGTSPGFLSVSLERAKVYAPMRAAYLSPGRTYLVKQALNQISQQAANKRGQRCPEEVQHRHLTSFRRTCPRAGQYLHHPRKATPFLCLTALPPLTKG